MTEFISEYQVSDQIQGEILVDGIAFVGPTWNFLETDKQIDISFPSIVIIREASKFLKGMKYFEGIYQLFTFKLFELNNFKVYLCLHDTKDGFIELAKLNKHISKQIDNCVEQMKTTETFNRLAMSLVPNISERGIGCGSTFTVFVRDYKKFGKRLAYLLNDTTNIENSQLPNTLKFCFVGTNF